MNLMFMDKVLPKMTSQSDEPEKCNLSGIFQAHKSVHGSHAASLGQEKALRLLASWNQPTREREENQRFQANILDIDSDGHPYPIMGRLLAIHS